MTRSRWLIVSPLLLATGVWASETASHRPQPAPLIRHQATPPLAADATISDWPQFLGHHGDMTCHEQPLNLTFGSNGPPLIWEVALGSGYAAPSIAGKRLVFFHRIENEARVECIDAETGESSCWSGQEIFW